MVSVKVSELRVSLSVGNRAIRGVVQVAIRDLAEMSIKLMMKCCIYSVHDICIIVLETSTYTIYVKRIPRSSVFIAKGRVSGIMDRSLKGTASLLCI